ncbi:MAG: glycoside hydrolase family 13 protein [Actinomycetota bacterium]|nr:glycoside hydrolase family 13 protein [Actinomycetota bacterium]
MPSKAERRPLADDHGVYGSPGDLSPWDVRFDPVNRAFLDSDADGSVRFRVWTDPALSDGMLVVRQGKEVAGYLMARAAQTIRFIYWEVVVGPFVEDVEYSFAFSAPNGKGVYRVPSGISNAVERIDRWKLTASDALDVPDWVKGAGIYQIFPDRFARSEHADDTGLHPWGSPPERRGFQGGDLGGIIRRLDYLSEMGVDVLYLNPIFVSPSNHRYDTVDYYTVDPMLGGNQALKDLVAEAHARSIRVILDASFNHVHPRFFAFADVAEKGPDSEYWDWFVVEEWPVSIRYRSDRAQSDSDFRDYIDGLGTELGFPLISDDGIVRPVQASFEAWYGVPTMPRVNLANPEARSYMLDVAAHWPREYDIDGWRMDVVRYVDPDFWNDFREVVRAVKPDAYLLCEVMGDASPWLQGDRFDATMNYTFRDLCTRFFAAGDLGGDGMIDGLSRMWAQYAWPVTLANQNLIGSHDTGRFLTESAGETWRLRLATVLQLTYPGAPGIYYGDEVGLEGGDEPASRGAFPWEGDPTEHDPTEHEVHQTLRELGQLRRKEPALVTGEWRPLEGRDGFLTFQRTLGDRRLVVAINRSDEVASFSDDALSEVLWGEGSVEGSIVTMAPRAAVVVA